MFHIKSMFVRGAFVAAFLSAAVAVRADQVVELSSGFGDLYAAVPHITFLAGPADAPFAAPFTSSDFQAARSGPNAWYTNRNPYWFSDTASLGGDWISTQAYQDFNTSGSSALFAIDFELVDTALTAATLNLVGGVDNELGEDGRYDINGPLPDIAGVYLNGQALSGDTTVTGGVSSTPPFEIVRNDVVNLLNPGGLNTLYIYMQDFGGPSGLAFSATLDVQGVAVPEPASGILVAAIGLPLLRRRSQVR